MTRQRDLDDWAVIGRLGHARGLRGELLGRANYTADHYGWVKCVALRLPDGCLAGDGALFDVESIRDYKDGLIYKFRQIGSRSEAEAVEQAEVLVKESERPALQDGEFYLSDLIGARVTVRSTGEAVGEVVAWQEFGGPAVIEVRTSRGRMVMIPLVSAICVEIDISAKTIAIDPPVGLLELNEEEPRA